jgi:hypothetical protein
LLDQGHNDVESEGCLLEDAVIGLEDLSKIAYDVEEDKVRPVNPAPPLSNQLSKLARWVSLSPSTREVDEVICFRFVILLAAAHETAATRTAIILI